MHKEYEIKFLTNPLYSQRGTHIPAEQPGGWYCHSCHRLTPKSVFRLMSTRVSASGRVYTYGKCHVCWQTQSDQRKNANRPLNKCRWARSRWSRKLGISTRKLRFVYGWELYQMDADLRAAYALGDRCSCCHLNFSHPDCFNLVLWDVSQPPDYRTNMRWLCKVATGLKNGFDDLAQLEDFLERYRERNDRES